MMRIKICPICVAVSLLWLLTSAGVAWRYFAFETYLVPIALLMGGSVVGIAYLGEKRVRWAIRHPLAWKTLVIVAGMAVAYLFVNNLSKPVVLMEFILMGLIARLLFIPRPSVRTAGGPGSSSGGTNVRKIEEQMEQCC